ncbi:sulfotransferase family protein [Rhodohalobacter sp. 614A]|uniref:sulfotransferase family protein n=1 Tax=Rhodohalobacter sp. 614A TaxID=2908649 RepID=UPI001F1D9581|nr:sulfotransferase family protein [Rhodohalobacter sp. 614A]
MLFPELSRLEIDSMKASGAFFLGIPKRLIKRKRKKVFIIGFHKTGTSSMGKAFQILGYRVCGNIKKGRDYEKVDMPTREYILSKAEELTSRYDCFQDTPWFMFYKELYEMYPDAYFILTIRPDENWIKSVLSHFSERENSSYHKWIYGHSDPKMNKEIYLSTYQRHNREVREFFSDKPNFLEIELKEKDKWEKICALLGIRKPMVKFPHVNTISSRNRFNTKLKEKVKDLYYK